MKNRQEIFILNRRLLITVVFTVVFLGEFNSIFGQQIQLNSSDVRQIGGEVHYLEADAELSSWKEAYGQLDKFEPIEKPIFTGPPKDNKLWCYFTATNKTNEDIWIDIDNSSISDLKLYKISSSGVLIDSLQTSVYIQKSKRAFASYTFWLPLVKAADTNTYQYLISLETYISRDYPIYAGSKIELINNERIDESVSIFFVGSVTIMLLFIFSMYIFLKNRLYLFYSMNLFAIIISATYFNKFPIMESFTNATFAHEYLGTWAWFGLITSSVFAIEYFKMYKNHPVFFRLLVAESILLFLIFPLNLFVPLVYLTTFFEISVGIFYLTFLYIGFNLLYKKVEGALFFCMSWTVLFISIMVMLFATNGLLPYNFILRNSLYVGTWLEMLLFSIALGYKVNLLRQEAVDLNAQLSLRNTELIDINSSLDLFTYHVSHDLKTVLNNAKGLANMIIKYGKKNDIPKILEISGKMNTVVDHGTETVKGFLEIGKIERYAKNETGQYMNLKDCAINTMQKNNLAGKIELIIAENQLGPVFIEVNAFESIFLNFLTNSIKYNNNKPVAKLRILDRNTHFEVIYSDNGVGVDIENEGEKLFEPFYRLNNAKGKEGSGVGLYLVKRIIQNMGGKIEAESELGKGLQFKITLPKVKP